VPLASPTTLRLSNTHIAFLEQVREGQSHASRAAVIRSLIEDARTRYERQQRRQGQRTAAN
jgi:Arc/MetJ-type ribon-helix-helix transcriptional regulator